MENVKIVPIFNDTILLARIADWRNASMAVLRSPYRTSVDSSIQGEWVDEMLRDPNSKYFFILTPKMDGENLSNHIPARFVHRMPSPLDRIGMDPDQWTWITTTEEAARPYNRFDLVGYCGLNKIHPVNRSAEISLLIDPTYRHQRIGSEAVTQLLTVGFKEMGLRTIWGESYMTTEVLSFWLKAGFKQEGVLRDRKFWNGIFHDSVIFSMLDEEFNEEYHLKEFKK